MAKKLAVPDLSRRERQILDALYKAGRATAAEVREAIERDRAKKSALRHMLDTFFEGSATQAIAALLDEDSKKLSDEDWDRLGRMVERARKEGA
jgi:predicted transcriptional regulator